MQKQSWLFLGGVVVVIAMLGALLWQGPTAAPAPALVPALPSATTPVTAEVAAAATAHPVSTSTLTPRPATAAAAANATAVVNATAPATPRPFATLPPLTAIGTGRIDLGDGLAITLTTGWLGAPHPLPAALGFTDPNGCLLYTSPSPRD